MNRVYGVFVSAVKSGTLVLKLRFATGLIAASTALNDCMTERHNGTDISRSILRE